MVKVWPRHCSVVLDWLAREAPTLGIGPAALPFNFFFPAVAIVAWFGGFGPGVLAVAMSTLAANWFFTAPVHAFSITSRYYVLALVAFLSASLLIVRAIQAMHRARRRLADEIAERKYAKAELVKAHDLLATTVASIGDAVILSDHKGNVS